MYNLNFDGQPINKAFNFSRNRDKSAFALRGILQGVVADEKLNEMELLFLDTWMRSQENLDHDGDVIDLLDLIGDVLSDGYISKKELEDLKNLITDIIEYGKQSSEEVDDCINELLGLLLGISSDNQLTNEEFVHLDDWLKSNSQLSDKWPANVLIERIQEIKSDGIVDEDEKSDLLETLKKITGQRFEETGAAEGATAEVFSEDISEFNHNNIKICFTGKFVSDTRKACEKSAKAKGALIAKSITKDLDVLVLGTLASRDWKFTSHGKKIEKALNYREKGQDIVILSERSWLKFI